MLFEFDTYNTSIIQCSSADITVNLEKYVQGIIYMFIYGILYTGKTLPPFYFHPFAHLPTVEFKTGLIQSFIKAYVRK